MSNFSLSRTFDYVSLSHQLTLVFEVLLRTFLTRNFCQLWIRCLFGRVSFLLMSCYWIILIFIFFPAYNPGLLFLNLKTLLWRHQMLISIHRKAWPRLFEAAFLFLLYLPKWGEGLLVKVVVVRVSQVVVRVDTCAGFLSSVSFVAGAHRITLSVLNDCTAI